ncbi:hypothetical protein K438DRAFT_1970531 [Mycena galopus ATCC 62051]|nr:hypothetical protein K438DRAFT_1970531 [Mycena galopus ATCC 62051]
MSDLEIALPPILTSEMVEFWGFKYKEARQEIEALKTRLQANDNFLQDVITSSQTERRIALQKLEACRAENTNLLVQVGKLNTERVALQNQIQSYYSQVLSLAQEAHRRRMAAALELFKPVNFFLDDSFTPDAMNAPWQLYFIPQPPHAIPLRVESPGQHGYWFYPFNLSPIDSQFELIVEVEPAKWLYYGRYITQVFQGFEMKLSEWMSLDEQVVLICRHRTSFNILFVQTKMIFCSRVASREYEGGQQAPYATQMHVRRSYDAGQWNIPSYILRCVGYDMAIYDALAVTAANMYCQQEISISKGSLQTRHRTETQCACEFDERRKAEGSKLVLDDDTTDSENGHDDESDSVGELEDQSR